MAGKKSDGSREKILEVCKELFSVHGLRGISNRDIAEAAGVNSALIHYYFGSKEGIYKFILESYGEMANDGVRGILREPEGAADFKLMFEIYTKQIVANMAKDLNGYLVVVRESDIMSKEFVHVFDGSFNQFNVDLLKFLKQAQKKKIFNTKIDCQHLMDAYWALIMYQTRLDKRFASYTGNSITDEKFRNEFVSRVLDFLYARMGL